MKILQFLIDWSEVWALLIPLLVILVYKPRGPFVNWLTGYVVFSFILNTAATLMVEYHNLFPLSISKMGNNVFYNMHSFIMVVFLGWYIVQVRKYRFPVVLKALIFAYLIFVIINFIFWETPLLLSTRHYAVGSFVLLLICLSYFFRSILEDGPTNWLKHPSFIICAGLCFYQAVTFFIFLFLYPLFDTKYNEDISFALLMMKVYQVVFVGFCITLAIGLFKYRKQLNK